MDVRWWVLPVSTSKIKNQRLSKLIIIRASATLVVYYDMIEPSELPLGPWFGARVSTYLFGSFCVFIGLETLRHVITSMSHDPYR